MPAHLRACLDQAHSESHSKRRLQPAPDPQLCFPFHHLQRNTSRKLTIGTRRQFSSFLSQLQCFGNQPLILEDSLMWKTVAGAKDDWIGTATHHYGA